MAMHDDQEELLLFKEQYKRDWAGVFPEFY